MNAVQPISAAEPALPKTLLSIRGVNKRFSNGTLALKDVNLDLGTGEFVSLLGPSGCGKSTLLRLIAGLGQPSEGRIDWHGDRARRGAADRVGFVFQEPTLMPWSKVLANVMLPLTLKRSDRKAAEARARDLLALVGLAGFENAYPRELSGGMRMRVSIARALITEPSLLLMDEPFAALDEITRHRLNDDLLRLWSLQKFSAVFVTHSVFESVYLSQRVVVMAARPGRVSAETFIGADYPRNQGFRTSGAYGEFCRLTSNALGEAIGQ